MKYFIQAPIAGCLVLTTAFGMNIGCHEPVATKASSATVEDAPPPTESPPASAPAPTSGVGAEPRSSGPNAEPDSAPQVTSMTGPTPREGSVESQDDSSASAPNQAANAAASPTLRRMPASTYGNALRELFGEAIVTDQRVVSVRLPVALELNNFDNNAAVDVASPALVEAYQNRAVAISEHLLGHFPGLFGCDDLDDEDHHSCMTEGFERLARRAWRRPLTDDERTNLSALRREMLTDFSGAEANALVLQFILQSPHFLYYPEFGTPEANLESGTRALTAFELAARMAAFLWDSIPDEDLLHAAESGALNNTDQIKGQARRMLSDARAKQAVQNFYRQLLEFDAIGGNRVNFSIFLPEDTDQVDPVENDSDYLVQMLVPAMRAEATIMVDQAIFHRSGTLGGLLSDSRGYVTYDTANIYGENIPEDAPVMVLEDTGINAQNEIGEIGEIFEVELNPDQRAGFLTTLGFLNSHSKPLHPSPVERGVYVLDRILCNKPAPPPDQVPDLDEATANMEIKTNRDRYAQHTSDPACAGCHTLIDGIGFTFENYDTLGDWRDTDNGHSVDASGELLATDVDGPVTDAVEMIHRLAGSRRVHDCHVTNWSRYALGRSINRFDTDSLNQLKSDFWASQGNIQSLLVELVASPMFRTLQEVSP
ncbi:MAG: DUF1588 domain-containing protein [Myxococcota bacterium]|nr:DUF1588 domain-containing protein [Myxococcota bacterium]